MDELYYKATSLLIDVFDKLWPERNLIKTKDLSDRKKKILLDEFGELFSSDKVLFSDNFIIFPPSIAVSKDGIHSFAFEKDALQNRILKFSEIRKINYSLMPCQTIINIVTTSGSSKRIYYDIPDSCSYSEVKKFDRLIKNGKYKEHTLCYLICIYVLTAIKKCEKSKLGEKFSEIEKNVKQLLEYNQKAMGTSKQYGDFFSFDFVVCNYDARTVEMGLRKVAEAKGEIYNEKINTIINAVQKTVEYSIKNQEQMRERVLKDMEKKVATAKNNGVDNEIIIKAEEKLKSVNTCINNSHKTDNLFTDEGSSLTVPAQIGSTNVAFVFSCPGQKEQNANRVCAGATGESLQELIEYCYYKRPDIFTSSNKNDYTITNASNRVHYMALTNDTEASYAEIQNSENIERFKKDLENCDIVICMGERASFAAYYATISAKVIRGEHLSAMHLNRIYKASADNSSARRSERIHMVADKILNQL